MKRQALERVIDEHVHKMKKHCAPIPGSFAADDIHDLRVEYKKSRAFVRLLQLESDAGHLRLPADLKQLYQAAGKVRDLQLFISEFPIAAAVPCFIECRERQLFYCKEELVIAIEQVNFKKALQGIYKALPHDLHENTTKRFLDQKIATIHIILQVAEEENDLHEVRKQVKDIIYNHKLVEEELETTFPLPGLHDQQALADIATQLGDFNDRCHALALLLLAKTDQLPQNEIEALKDLETTWTQQKEEQQQQLLIQLQQLPITSAN